MKFAAMQFIKLFWMLVVLLGFFIFSNFVAKNKLSRLVDAPILKKICPNPGRGRIFARQALLFLIISCLIFSLMRPQWGFFWREVKREGRDIMIALDLSKSMLAQDIKPDRLVRAKMAIKDLTEHLEGDRIGIIGFAGTAYLACPLTVDYSGFLLCLDAMEPSSMPVGGTNISAAIKESIKAFANVPRQQRVLIIITDGEDHQGRVLEAAKLAHEEGIKIFCIGIGSKEGDIIPISDQETGERTYLRDREGKIVKTSLNEKLLRRMVIEANGSYVKARPENMGLISIYDNMISSIKKRLIKGKMQKVYYERFQWPLFAGIILLVLEQIICII